MCISSVKFNRSYVHTKRKLSLWSYKKKFGKLNGEGKVSPLHLKRFILSGEKKKSHFLKNIVNFHINEPHVFLLQQ